MTDYATMPFLLYIQHKQKQSMTLQSPWWHCNCWWQETTNAPVHCGTSYCCDTPASPSCSGCCCGTHNLTSDGLLLLQLDWSPDWQSHWDKTPSPDMSVKKTQECLLIHRLASHFQTTQWHCSHLACLIHCWPLGVWVIVEQQVLNGIFLWRRWCNNYNSNHSTDNLPKYRHRIMWVMIW